MFGGIRRTLVALIAAIACLCAAAPLAFATPDPAQLLPDDIALVESTHIKLADFQKQIVVWKVQSDKPLRGEERVWARTQIVDMFLRNSAYEQEAAQLGIVVSDKSVKQRFLPLKEQSFPEERDYRRFLKNTKQTTKDILALIRSQMVRERVQKLWLVGVAPTEEQIQSEYNDHLSDYSTPEERDLRLIFTYRKARAKAAKAELEAGRPFAKVARKYSNDSASKAHGGLFPNIIPGQFEPALDKAMFGARRGQLVGPIKTQYGFYLFKVVKIRPAIQQTLAQATTQIRAVLGERLKSEQLKSQSDAFDARWKAATICRASYVTDHCGSTVP